MSSFYKAVLARGLGYTTANFTALISPILMYTLTHSLVLAGLGLVVELIPKMLVYLYGSSWIQRYSAQIVHPMLESARLLCLVLLLCVSLSWFPWWMIPLAGAIMQIANAFSNLLFEQHASSWSVVSTQHTYTAFVQADLIGGLCATGLTMYLGTPSTLLFIAIGVQSFLFFFIMACKNTLYSQHDTSTIPWTLWLVQEYKRPWNTIRKMDSTLWFYVLFCLCFSFPVAVLFSHLAFFLEHAYQKIITQEFFATINLIRLFMGFIAMSLSLKLTRLGWEKNITIGGFMLFGLGALGLIGSHHVFVGGILLIGVSYYLLTPWLRRTRQHLTQLPEYHTHKNELVGLMIACDALAYFMAGALATLHIPLMTITTIAFIFTIIMGTTMFYKLRFHFQRAS